MDKIFGVYVTIRSLEHGLTGFLKHYSWNLSIPKWRSHRVLRRCKHQQRSFLSPYIWCSLYHQSSRCCTAKFFSPRNKHFAFLILCLLLFPPLRPSNPFVIELETFIYVVMCSIYSINLFWSYVATGMHITALDIITTRFNFIIYWYIKLPPFLTKVRRRIWWIGVPRLRTSAMWTRDKYGAAPSTHRSRERSIQSSLRPKHWLRRTQNHWRSLWKKNQN